MTPSETSITHRVKMESSSTRGEVKGTTVEKVLQTSSKSMSTWKSYIMVWPHPSTSTEMSTVPSARDPALKVEKRKSVPPAKVEALSTKW